MNETQRERRLAAAIAWGREAGERTLRLFGDSELVVERKTDDSPVTLADRDAEQFLRDRITEAFPGDAIVGEEWGNIAGTSPWRWILDPIDGTKSFVAGVPLYSTLIGVECDGVMEVGVIVLPALGEMVWASHGGGAWYTTPRTSEPIPARVSECSSLSDATFLTSDVTTFDSVPRGREVYHAIARRCRVNRTWGDAYGYALVATGRAELMIDPVMNIWDAAPLGVILTEAGGRFTDWRGHAIIDGGNGIGTNGLLHNAVLEIVQP